MSTLADRKVLLRLIDRGDYTFAGLRAKDLPEEIPAGRAFEAGSGMETQLAMLRPDLAPHEQTAYLRQVGGELTQRDRDIPRSARPFRVREIPAFITYRQAAEQAAGNRRHGPLLVGIGGQDVEAITHDPRKTASFVIAGPAGSGRSNALLSMTLDALAQGYQMMTVTPRTSPLRHLDETPGVIATIRGTTLTAGDLAPHLDPPVAPTIVAIDDAELLRDAEADGWLRDYLTRATDHAVSFLIAGDAEALGKGFTGWLIEARKSRRGLILNPADAMQGDVVGLRLSRSDIQQERPIGRGWATDPAGQTVLIQIPEATEEHPTLIGAN